MKSHSRTVPGTVRYTTSEDVELAVRGLLGQSLWAIMDATGLRLGQVNYRLRKAGIKLRPFRDGEGQFAQSMLAAGRGAATSHVRVNIAPRFRK